ncbi:hypothetical protein CTAYLR_005673 [Chrysophaeum taylorii]|uniref:Fatty acid desaturase domain-containing protein n=1 Tax=Chrysophaeum taylorii TaxID=2483200 RepID=A0AAD7XP06_9STRA|nr:hypothetical protein CTAYLR_005673 [Chrysophaeum taylorii]
MFLLFLLIPAVVALGDSGAAAAWHAKRRRAITREVGRETIDALCVPRPGLTLGSLVAVDAAQMLIAANAGDWWAPVALTAGAWLSLAQFSLLHDVLHSGAKHRSKLLFALSMPAAFGVWLYLDRGHLNHHKFTGDSTIRELFESSEPDFEDGDLFFASHRQETRGGVSADPRTVSISRFAYRKLWGSDPSWNMLVYSTSQLAERAALAAHEKLVALAGYNVFFPNKPKKFHDAAASYARYAALVQAILWTQGGWQAIAYLWLAETAWQLPLFPASSLYFSNHASRATDGVAVGGGLDPAWPTHSVYDENNPFFDLLCCYANYHLEHHDFPNMPLWSLRDLRRLAGPAWYPASPPWPSIILDTFQNPITYPAWRRDDLPPLNKAD